MKDWVTIILISITWHTEVAAQRQLPLNAANTTDHYIVFANPAGIVSQGKQGMAGTQWLHAGLPGDNLRYNAAFFTFPVGGKAALGLRSVHFSSNILQEGTFSLLFGHKLFEERLRLGLNANLLYFMYDRDKFEGFNRNDPVLAKGTAKNAFSLGAGVLLWLSERLACGFSVDDINRPDIALGAAAFETETRYNLGAVYLNPLLSPQLDLQRDGREVSMQAGAHRRFLDEKAVLFAGYRAAGAEGGALLFEIGFLPGDWGLSGNFRRETDELGQAGINSYSLALHFKKAGSAPTFGAPILELDNPKTTVVKTELFVLSGEARSHAGIDRVEYLLNGKAVQVQAVDPASKKAPLWLSFALQEGDNEIIVVAHAGERRSSRKIHVKFAPVVMPPRIALLSSSAIELDTTVYHLRASITDPRGLQSIRVLVNGEERRRIVFADTTHAYELSDSVTVLEGRNSVEIIATNDKRVSREHANDIFCHPRGLALAPPEIIIHAPEKLKTLRLLTPHGAIRLEWEIKNIEALGDITLRTGNQLILLTESDVLTKTRRSMACRKDLILSEGKNDLEIIARGTRHTVSTQMEVFYNPLLAKRLYGRTWAIIIGINTFRDREITPLQYAVHDARGVETALRERFQFDRLIALYEEEASKKNIMAALFDSLKSAHEEDGVFVFVATHGGIKKTSEGELGYLVPYDGNWEFYRDNITESEIRDAAKLTKAKHIFFAIDACYSGALLAKRGQSSMAGATVDYSAINALVAARARNVLAAGRPNEQVLDGGLENHSIFTGRFLEGLRGPADDNGDSYITADEIGRFVIAKVSQDAILRHARQNPLYGDLTPEDGQFLFIPKGE